MARNKNLVQSSGGVKMKQEVIQIFTSIGISREEMIRVPEEVIGRKINNELARGIAHYIMDNTEKIPMTIEKRQLIERDGEEHILRLNIISDEELRRLRQIERDMEQLRYSR
jgi:hypothetical protein